MIEKIHSLFLKSNLISTDTRDIIKNSIFFALKGDNFDANKFAEEALIKGASYAVIDNDEYFTNDNILLVDDVLNTLQELATYHREQLGIPIIALTGSNGKTTTKELIYTVLNQKFNTTATKGNFNNHIGVPLTLLSMNKNTEIGVVEMGANHPKEIEFLCNIAKPDYGYITNFGKAHLEGFGSIEGVITAKTELYRYLKSNGKIAFINTNDKIQVEKSEDIKTVNFGANSNMVSIKMIDANPFVRIQYEDVIIQSNLIGAYNANNIAAAITIGDYFKITKNTIKKALEDFYPTNNRSQIIKIKNTKVILDAYNANPTSMKAALENFNNLTDKNKIVILGDMFEVGKYSDIEHQNITDMVSNSKWKVFLIGENFKKTKTNNKHVKFYLNYTDFTHEFNKTNFDNTTVLIKASRGMALERIVKLLKT